jgi:two-component system sensor histidine kinase YesM
MFGPAFFLQRINDIPLKYKFLLIYFLCVLLPIIVINVFFYQRNSADIKLREMDNLRKSIERASGELSAVIEESVALSRSIASDAAINEVLDRTYADPVEYFVAYHDFLRNNLTRYTSTYPNISDIRIYTDNGSIQTGSNYYVIGRLSGVLPWLEQFHGRAGDVHLAAYEEQDFLNPGRRISVLSKMNLYAANSKYRKYLRVDLNPEKIYSIMKREDGWLRLLLIDDAGRVVLDSANMPWGGGDTATAAEIPAQTDRSSGYVLEHSLGNAGYILGWKLVGIADTRRIEMLHDAARRSILWLAAISAVIPTILINILFRSYHYRVNKLARHMARIRDERFEPIAIAEGRDEIGALIRSFNTMAQKIHSLIHEVYKLEIRQKSLELEHLRAELSALHSQVNPHFLFNTLNALYVVCVKNGYGDVASVIRDLSLLMRQMLGRADDLIPLREELQFTAMYLQIEKFRFGDLFEYAFQVDPAADELRIPRMSVQLLVENACKHGLQARRDNRKVFVTARLEDGALAIAVADNGIGMEEEKLRQVMDAARTDSAGGEHVGIRNVYKRLELYYRSMAAFRIDSSPGVGTTVEIRIPIKLLMEDDGKEGR